MARVFAKLVSVDFPVYDSKHRSLKNALVRTMTGGSLSQDTSNHVIVQALREISFDFQSGARVGLIGHNGSGKTTLLRVLSGVYIPTRGELKVEGKIATMINLTLGMDFDLSGRENILIRGSIMGMSRQAIRNVTEDIIEFADLGDFIDLPMRTYSSGMSMRLAFALATCGNADIILMDEWMSAGDADFQSKAEKRLLTHLKKAEIVFIASHNTSLVTQQCNWIVRMTHGRIDKIEANIPRIVAKQEPVVNGKK